MNDVIIDSELEAGYAVEDIESGEHDSYLDDGDESDDEDEIDFEPDGEIDADSDDDFNEEL